VSTVDLGALEAFADGKATHLDVGGAALVVVRIGDVAYVLEDRCSHEEFPLSLGEVDADDCTLECDRHGAIFDLTDGSPLSLPATKPVKSYVATVDNGRVTVELP
jgi:3-phenylpropionate/trans-cinnamate dioxygenase ferredoxin component